MFVPFFPSQDAECLACKEVVGKNLDGYEQCIKYYGYEEDVCINQASLSVGLGTAGTTNSWDTECRQDRKAQQRRTRHAPHFY